MLYSTSRATIAHRLHPVFLPKLSQGFGGRCGWRVLSRLEDPQKEI
jgi:hypothetical protein